MPRACPSPADLEAAALQGVQPPDFADHVADCSACRQQIEELRENDRFLRHAARLIRAGPTHRPPVPAELIEGYELLEEISRGGQGVVYRAVQSATRRPAAVKMLLAGAIASGRQLRRFEREIEIAARLRHPNVVTVFGSGKTADGRRYVAMEFVEGVPLDRYLNQSIPEPGRTRTEAAVRLMLAVAHGVGQAHAHGVIHRDLKPSNILVDAGGAPRVLDFGLARSIDMVSDATFTLEFAGTPAYAAPEQFRGDPAAIGTATDVYALGVIFYQALADRRPYSCDGSLSELARQVATATPAPPSQIVPRLPSDVETIVLKAMSKEPHRRYASAAALAADIEDYLAGRPISARRDSAWYVLCKAAVMNRQALLGAVAGLAVISISLTLLLLSQARIAASRQREQFESQRADAEATTARAVAHIVSALVPAGEGEDDDPADSPRKAIFDRLYGIERQIDLGAFADDPRYEMELRTTIAALYGGSWMTAGRGEVAARQSLLARQRLYGPDHAQTAAGHHELARILLARKRPKEAVVEAGRSIEIFTARLGHAHRRTLESRALLARALLESGRTAEALAQIGPPEATPDSPPGLVVRWNLVRAEALAAIGEVDSARVAAREALHRAAAELADDDADLLLALTTAGRLRVDLVGSADPSDPASPGLVSPPHGESWCLRLAEELAGWAESPRKRSAVLHDLARLREVLLGQDHRAVGLTLAACGLQHRAEENALAAREPFERAILILERASGPSHPIVAALYGKLGDILMECGDFPAATSAILRAMSAGDSLPAADRDELLLAIQHRYAGQALLLAGRPEEAERVLREGMARLTKLLGPDHYAVGFTGCLLGWALAELGRFGEAENQARFSYALTTRSTATPPDQRDASELFLGIVLQRVGCPEEAMCHLEAGLAPHFKRQNGSAWLDPFTTAYDEARRTVSEDAPVRSPGGSAAPDERPADSAQP